MYEEREGIEDGKILEEWKNEKEKGRMKSTQKYTEKKRMREKKCKG